MAAAWKLILLVAVLLMPFGMTAAPAAAGQHHSAAIPMQHCPDQGSSHGSKVGVVECMMVCSSALPAADLPEAKPMLLACAPEMSGVTQMLHGLHPETATPPPKRS